MATAQWALAPADLGWVTERVAEFEREWDAQRLAAALAELPGVGDPRRLPTLFEMVKIDLARSWGESRPAHIEDYLLRCPELGSTETVSAELLEAEYEARRAAGLEVGRDEFVRRFPRHATRLAPASAPLGQAVAPTAAAAASWWFCLGGLPAFLLALPFGAGVGLLATAAVLAVAAVTALAAGRLVRHAGASRFRFDAAGERLRAGFELLWLPPLVAALVLAGGPVLSGGSLGLPWLGWGLLGALLGGAVGFGRFFLSWLRCRHEAGEGVPAAAPVHAPAWPARIHMAGRVLLALRDWPTQERQSDAPPAFWETWRPAALLWGSYLTLLALACCIPDRGPKAVEVARAANESTAVNAGRTPGPAPTPAPTPTPAPRPATQGIPPALLGTWLWEDFRTIRVLDEAFVLTSKHWVTIGADGRFTDRSGVWSSFPTGTGDTDVRRAGTVTVQGNVLTFQSDSGERWAEQFQVEPGRLILGGKEFLR